MDKLLLGKEFIWESIVNKNSPKARSSQYDAMREAVDECIEQGILVEFLTKNKAGVINMYLTEWDEESYRTALKQESWEDGKVEGKLEGKAEGREEINELNQCLKRHTGILKLHFPRYVERGCSDYRRYQRLFSAEGIALKEEEGLL